MHKNTNNPGIGRTKKEMALIADVLGHVQIKRTGKIVYKDILKCLRVIYPEAKNMTPDALRMAIKRLDK